MQENQNPVAVKAPQGTPPSINDLLNILGGKTLRSPNPLSALNTRPNTALIPGQNDSLDSLVDGLIGPLLQAMNEIERIPEAPRFNVFDSGDQVRVEVLVPGFDVDEISVTTENSILTINVGRGEKCSQGCNCDDQTYVRRGFYLDPFQIKVDLPPTYRPDNVNVRLTKGILVVSVDRPEEYKLRSIPISTDQSTVVTPVVDDQ